jgi:ethanolamine utilization protein EutJ
MNPQLQAVLGAIDRVVTETGPIGYRGSVRVGVDLGTAYTVLIVLDATGTPIAGEYHFAQVVRDGVVVDFAGASALVRAMKNRIEGRLGFELTRSASSFPPGVPHSEVRAVRYVLESAGLECSGLVDEPSAANSLLGITNGAVVDIGGGTTGVAVIENGAVVYTADEPTGGTHLSLVISGAHKVSFEEAEAMKTDPAQHRTLFPVVRPVMEKIGTIIGEHIRRFSVDTIYLVGGTSSFAGIAEVVREVTGVHSLVPGNPLFVTPIGIALNDKGD